MSEYLEALECLESIKDALWDEDFHYQRHSKLLDTIEEALERLESIDNANPSEALNKLGELKYNIQDEIGYYYKGYTCCKEEVHKYDEDFKIIEQALLKAQEPKHYLKWEDLEFKDAQQEIKVKLGTLTYSLWYCLEHKDQCVELTRNQQSVIVLYSIYQEDILFFNELHLEVVE